MRIVDTALVYTHSDTHMHVCACTHTDTPCTSHMHIHTHSYTHTHIPHASAQKVYICTCKCTSCAHDVCLCGQPPLIKHVWPADRAQHYLSICCTGCASISLCVGRRLRQSVAFVGWGESAAGTHPPPPPPYPPGTAAVALTSFVQLPVL